MYEYIASFDIGKVNFAFCIEKISKDNLTLIKAKNIPRNKRYNKDLTPTDDFSRILNEVYEEGEIILIRNLDLTQGCDNKKYLDTRVFLNLTLVLDNFKSYWDICSTFIIEQQMSFGKNKINTMAIKIAQHVYSYFIFTYSSFKEIVEFPSYHKTKILGCPKNISKTKPGRKKWSVEKANFILSLREDLENLKLLNTKGKKDDLADVITQLQAYKYLKYVDEFKATKRL